MTLRMSGRFGIKRVSTSELGGIAAEWDALADAVGASPWARPGWIDIWSRCFGRSAEAMVLRRDGALLAVAPLTRGRLLGAVGAANGHTPWYVVLAADTNAEEALVRGIVEQEGSLRISHM